MATLSSARAPEPALVIVDRLRARGRPVVALSGGVDSAVVAALAFAAFGREAVALTLVGSAVSRAEVARAQSVARTVGIEHHLVSADPLADPEYAANPPNRCYFCRRVEGRAIRTWAEQHGAAQWLDGVHEDDLGDDRPGLKAMDEAGFGHPLLEAGWGKSEVRDYAKEVGLPNWDAPSEACLASRIAHGRPVTEGTLRQVEQAEEVIRALGFRRVRVRTDGRSARVEVDPAEVGRLTTPPTPTLVGELLRELGFAEVSLDPAGYRSRPGA